jgi:glutamyl/glutaminyl-tRNA synthetase
MIYRALDMDIPKFAHIPLILGSDRSKLSKRHGAPNVRNYRREGYPPDAVVNYLAMLGWSSPDQKEILDLEELVSAFTLDRVSESPSIFDRTKLGWVSAQNIRAGKAEKYLNDALKYFPESFKKRYTDDEISCRLTFPVSLAKVGIKPPSVLGIVIFDGILVEANLSLKHK